MLRIAGLLLLAGCLASAWGGSKENRLAPAEKKEGYVLLFNGKNLRGWDGDPARWKVENGMIVGDSDASHSR